jgi:Ca-activated chloride channel family protein
LVLAMPEPMATAMGWPKQQLGWADVLGMVKAKDGWASKGHKEWGKFTLGKTNPNSSTSGLAATVGTLVAATGTSSDLTLADLKDPAVREFAETVERSVIHYGDTTLTYLSNLQRADDAGAAMNYLSAVAVEEKSVLDYNAGNPTGDPATLGQHAPPRVPLVAIYPKEGTLYSDSPYIILNAAWSTPQKQAGAKDFLDYLRQPEQQKIFTDANFRTYDGNAGTPITSSKYVDANGVKITLKPPSASVLAGVRALWTEVRKPARVLLVLDVSGSMGEPAGDGGETRLDLAKQAAIKGLDQLTDTDEVGLWTFTSGMESPQGFYTELVPIGPLAKDSDEIKAQIGALSPSKATPLYAVTRAASEFMNSTEDDAKINAVVLMTDGQNEYSPDSDLDGLLDKLNRSGVENGVRIFTIAYGEDADLDTLKKISEATRAAAYDARKPESIDKVFAAVLSNF